MSIKIRSNKQNCCCKDDYVAVSHINLLPDILTDYLLHREIEQYLNYLAKSYAHFVKKHVIGKSWNQLPISAIVIDWNNDTKEPQTAELDAALAHMPRQHRIRKTVLIEAGTHGCEWLGISTAICCIRKLVEHKECDTDLLRKLRFVIVPLSNPDGYEMSQTNLTWRQNSKGVDCNRNYDVNWQDGCDSRERCTYRGKQAFSEPESRAIRNLLYALGPQLLLVICLHSHAQCIMYPWGYKKEIIQAYDCYKELVETGRTAMRKYSGRHYRVGSIIKLMQRKITGSLVDFAVDVIKVPFVLCMELPARKLGFQPSRHHIAQLCTESWLGINQMSQTALKLLPRMASQRLLKTFQRPNYMESIEGLSKSLYEMDLHKICQSIEKTISELKDC